MALQPPPPCGLVQMPDIDIPLTLPLYLAPTLTAPNLICPGADAVPLVALAASRDPVNAGVARPLVEGLRAETVVRDERIRELVPIDPTPFDVAVRAALG